MEKLVEILEEQLEGKKQNLPNDYEDGLDIKGISYDVDVPEREIDCFIYEEEYEEMMQAVYVSPMEFWSYYDPYFWNYNNGYPKAYNFPDCKYCGETYFYNEEFCPSCDPYQDVVDSEGYLARDEVPESEVEQFKYQVDTPESEKTIKSKNNYNNDSK